mgnify:CR=1 FL=1
MKISPKKQTAGEKSEFNQELSRKIALAVAFLSAFGLFLKTAFF